MKLAINGFVSRQNRDAAFSKTSSKKSPYLRLKDGTQKSKKAGGLLE